MALSQARTKEDDGDTDTVVRLMKEPEFRSLLAKKLGEIERSA